MFMPPLAREPGQRFAAGQGNPERIVSSLLGIQSVFGEDLAGNATFERSVSAALRSLLERGARATVEAWIVAEADRSSGF